MRGARLLTGGLIGLLLTSLLGPPAYAGQRSDWFESKHITLRPVVKGLKEPTYVIGTPDGTQRLLVLERRGLIRVADADGQLHPTPFLDLSGQLSLGMEEGLLGLAFAPDFGTSGYVYVDYTAKDWSVQVVRYTISADDPNALDPASAHVILSLPKKSKYHNGGTVIFGPDGYLYVSVGDDEDSDSAQDLGTLVGKILRLDVDAADPYAVPDSNPFVDRPGARGEIWSYGLRNPWRFSFDRASGDLWIADVGDHDEEEVDFQPAASPGGENYGWPMYEGTRCTLPRPCDDEGLTAPVTAYGHGMNCAVIGGYVYRGPRVPALDGVYLFGDLCTGGVFALHGSPEQGWSRRLELGFAPGVQISSFGEDAAGDVYVVDYQGGNIYRVENGALP